MVTKVTLNKWNLYISIQLCVDIHIFYFFLELIVYYCVIYKTCVYFSQDLYYLFY